MNLGLSFVNGYSMPVFGKNIGACF